MRTLLTVILLSIFIYAAPLTASEKVKKSCTCSHSSPAGMERPRAIHIWRDDNRQILLEVEGDKNYRTRVDRKVLEAFTNLVRQHPLAAWNNFKDQPCHAWLEKRERESFSLVIIWESGKIDIHGTKLRPEGFRVFKNDVLSPWDKAVYRFP